MSTIVTRAGKGSPLTHNEVDANFNNLNNDKVEESTTITAGTGLSGGGDLSANRTISLANTAVTPGSYGSASAVGTFTVDAQGRLTAASNTNIQTPNSVTFNNAGAGGASGSTFNGSGALTVSYNTIGAPSVSGTNATGTWGISISGNAATATTASNVNNGTLTMNVSGTGLSGSQTFTANQSGNATFTVTSNATNANTGSTIVARDASGNFSAGTITATLSGNASTVTDGMYLASNQTSGGRKAFSASQASGSMLTATGSLGGLEAVTLGGANAAFMSFHRAGAYASYFGIDTDNNFAVGGWSAGAALASMKVGSFGVGTAASGTAGEIRATNNITAYYSDARLKDFKGKIDGALDKVSQLNGYYYIENAKAEEFGYNNKAMQVGVSAQEVQAVLPEIIAPAPFDMDAESKSRSGENYMTVRYERLVPLLIEAIKELKAEVEALKAKS